MAFRADEASRIGYERVESYLVPRARDVDEVQRTRSKEVLASIVNKLGPVVDAYPTWHPLVWNHDSHHPETRPNEECGYRGLDHTRFFANGFITCPYEDGQAVLDSVAALPPHPAADIRARRLDVQFYNSSAHPILVECHWHRPLNDDGTIPLAIAMLLLLQKELPCAEWASRAETWESMRPYFLGHPHGSRSSLFVNQETGQAMKKVWNTLISTGVFGSIKV